MAVKILIVDDHPLVREGLIGLLCAQRISRCAAKRPG